MFNDLNMCYLLIPGLILLIVLIGYLINKYPNDWVVIEKQQSKYNLSYYDPNVHSGLSIEKRKTYFTVLFSNKRNKHKITVEGYFPYRVEENTVYQQLKEKYKIK